MMLEIDRGFRPGGEFSNRLDGSTPFRQPGAEKRSGGGAGAIHDGIMNQPGSVR